MKIVERPTLVAVVCLGQKHTHRANRNVVLFILLFRKPHGDIVHQCRDGCQLPTAAFEFCSKPLCPLLLQDFSILREL
jgi:hypothetical protein